MAFSGWHARIFASMDAAVELMRAEDIPQIG